MELAQVGQLVGAFLGGGLTAQLATYLLDGRRKRQDELRKLAMERIALMRELLSSVVTYSNDDDPDRSDSAFYEAMQLGDTTVLELDDEPLHSHWSSFTDEVYRFSHEGKHGYPPALHGAVIKRLNELERRR